MTIKEGAPLHKVLKMAGSFNTDIILHLIYQILNILKYLHEKGILYRDLKASNLLIDLKGKISLIDFGLSKVIEKKR